MVQRAAGAAGSKRSTAARALVAKPNSAPPAPRSTRRLLAVASLGAAARASPASEGVIGEVVAELASISRAAGLATALQIGEIVFKKIFRGDRDALRSHGRKDASFRRLATHPKLPFSAATLWRSVAVYELTSRFPGIAKSRHLGVAHLRALIDLPGEVQERLLRAAEKEKWSHEMVEQRAAAHRITGASKGGRKTTPPELRCVRLFDKLLSSGALVQTGAVASLNGEAAARASEVVREVRKWCDAMEASLGNAAV